MELMVDYITSLDGYGAAEGWPGWWGLEGPEYLAWLGEDSKNQHTLLMGAKTYRLMHGFAPADEADDALGTMQKIVFSNTLTEPLGWANSRLVRGDAVDAVRELKETGEHPLSTIGSLSLARSLLAAGLVDRFRVVVFPVITGKTGQERIYDGYPDVVLDLTESRTFDGGIQLLDYRPRLLDAPLPPGPGSA
ncbi:dihydrofolate reductase family protein [Salana multivorans]